MFWSRRKKPEELASRPLNWIDPEEESLIPPRSVWVGPDDPITHYSRWVWEYLAYLTIVAGLQREDAVLELGCGHGRTARGLLSYLRSPGRYVGVDVSKFRIDDASARITARWGNFQFVHADVRSADQNPQGGSDAASYRFPFDDGSFDVVYAASLFTHLLPDEAQNYLAEARRVLKPNGRCLFSLFLLDHYRGPGTTISPLYEFEHPYQGHQGVAVRDPLHPHVVIGYNLEEFSRLAAAAGLQVRQVLPGLWTESPGLAVNEQDLLLLERVDSPASDSSKV